MKRLITTTAIAALMAGSVAAQTSDQTQAQSDQMQAGAMASGQMEIQASNLIGKRLYIQRENGGQMDAMNQSSAGDDDAAADGAMSGSDGMETAEAPAAGVSDSTDAPAGDEQTAQQQSEDQPAAEDGVTEQAQSDAPMEDTGTTEQAESAQPMESDGTAGAGSTQTADAAQAPAMDAGSNDMAQYEQGVADAPDTWTMAGEIDDVLLSQDGQVEALVVDAGGFLGMNESTRRIDIQEVRFVPDTDDEGEFFAVYAGDRQTFEGAQSFDEAALQEGTVRGTQMWQDEIAGQPADVAFTSITTDELVGTAVYGTDDNWVGEIGELALTDDGEIAAVIIDVGGFLGIGEKPVALSMDQIQLRRGEGGAFGNDLRAYVNATEDELESMEAWEEDAG